MISSVRKKIIITVVLVAALVCAAFFLLRYFGATVEAGFRNNQVFYAEAPLSPVQILSTLSSSTPSVASSTPDRARVPILVYHIVRPSYPSDSRAVKQLAQTPEIFDAQMQYLTDAGYHVVSFHALERYLKSGTPLPPHSVVISFDDGWSDQYRYAFPILKKYHYTATFFVFTNPIGTRGFMTWDNLREMRDAGMTIGSHSLSHPFLTKVTDPALLWKEIDGSKKTLEKNLSITVNEFAYPFGRYNADIEAMVVKAGYLSARGDLLSKKQSENPLFELSAQNMPTTVELFAKKFPLVK